MYTVGVFIVRHPTVQTELHVLENNHNSAPQQKKRRITQILFLRFSWFAIAIFHLKSNQQLERSQTELCTLYVTIGSLRPNKKLHLGEICSEIVWCTVDDAPNFSHFQWLTCLLLRKPACKQKSRLCKFTEDPVPMDDHNLYIAATCISLKIKKNLLCSHLPLCDFC